MKRQIQFTIPAQWQGTTLHAFLDQRFPYHSHDDWSARIREQRVLVNDRPAQPDTPLRLDDKVEYIAHDIPEPDVDTRVELLHQDADIAVINKPGNLPCHPGGRYFRHTLWTILQEKFGIREPVFVNRLDRETSGLILVARNEDAARECRDQFAKRRVQKRYVALVEGSFPDQVTASGYLKPDEQSPVRKKQIFEPADPPTMPPPSNWVHTRFRRLSVHGSISQVEADPLTGRLHQIRVTLCSLGFPIVGDKLYGPDPAMFLRFCKGELTDDDRRRLRMDRQALHASSLRFRHPTSHRDLHFELPLPADMDQLLNGPDSHANTLTPPSPLGVNPRDEPLKGEGVASSPSSPLEGKPSVHSPSSPLGGED